ncbi:hypothetical protein HDU96_007564 [Phlyctochytrium bullatum]|nr:hypothetical protein HDU96_007564 [Phlyctochytrium bullatum]
MVADSIGLREVEGKKESYPHRTVPQFRSGLQKTILKSRKDPKLTVLEGNLSRLFPKNHQNVRVMVFEHLSSAIHSEPSEAITFLERFGMPVSKWRGSHVLRGSKRDHERRQSHFSRMLYQAHESVAGLLFPWRKLTDEEKINFNRQLNGMDDSLFKDAPVGVVDMEE